MHLIKFVLIAIFLFPLSFSANQHKKPVLYIIGDSTVKNGDGKNNNVLQGWGSFIDEFFDTAKISVQNHAIGGRSSRTFISDGRWDRILANLQKGDYVIMQFGHNDAGALDDTSRARGTIKGIGVDSIKIYNPILKKEEQVHTYGWYLGKYIEDAKSKGAISIVCSPIPRNDWKDGKVLRSNDGYALWARQVAENNGAYFIDLNNKLADEYENIGMEKTGSFFPKEHTHTNKEGAVFNAGIVVQNVKSLRKCKLKKFLKD
ncbi:MAG: rhamnogalacturonan acetylesterase [Ferruginibacter sp.]